MITANYTVVGMTCDHCVMSVTEEVGEVPGTTDVDVDLATGRLAVTSGVPIDESLIHSAVAEAGYAIADET